MTPRRRRGTGLMVVEVAAMMPLIVAGLFFIIAAGRYAWAYVRVHGTAHSEARLASMQRTGSDAAAVVAADVAADQTGPCSSISTKVDTSDFHADGSVTVVVECHVTLGDLTLLRLPGAITVSETFTEPVDAFR